MDVTFTSLDADIKTFFNLMALGVKNRVRAMIQSAWDTIRIGQDPNAMAFHVVDAAMLLRRYMTHKKYVKDAPSFSEAAKLKDLAAEVKWQEWAPSFRNYFCVMPGRDGVPLSYVIRRDPLPLIVPGGDFLTQYVSSAPLKGETYIFNSRLVDTLIVKFISDNETAEAKIQHLAAFSYGRRDIEVLRNHYEGVGVNARDITTSEKNVPYYI
mmetsp:Transcript_640/g.1027  ORF Transcript_640/g.1027 Transcript_640/m.1027 type:complete len:211 (+) Transcript_640:528-1160(+)